MKANANTMMVDNYYGLLKGLSNDLKLKLIARLSNSIVEESTEQNINIDRFFGAFNSDKSAEEIIIKIKQDRNFDRTIEAL